MIEITKKVNVDELAYHREVPSVKTFHFVASSWAEAFAALAMWSQEHKFVIISLSYDVMYEDDQPYGLYITVDDLQKRKER